MGPAMRKSSLALGLVAMVLALFIFENMRALVATLVKNETTALVTQGDLRAELHLLKLRQGLTGDEAAKFFDRIESLPAPETGQTVVRAGKELRLEIRKPLNGHAGLLFHKTIASRQLDTLRGLKKVLSGLIIVLGLLIVMGGIYFMVRMIKKRPAEKKLDAGAPFQDYLIEMKNAQVELQSIVAAQRRASSEQEELNKSIINTVHLGVIYLSAAGKVEIFNPAAQDLFGRSFAAAKNAALADVLPGHPALVRFILSAKEKNSAEIESGSCVFYVDVVPVGAGRDGLPVQSDRDVGAQVAPPAVDGERQGRLALVRDVSEERQKERIRRQNDNLMMLGEMAASLAHEIRNSLGVVLGYSKALGGEPEKTRKVVREIEFMSEMMESFLRFARPVEKVNRDMVQLGEVIASAAAAQEVAVELPAGPMELKSDRLLLNVIFTNLALNARQAGATRLRVEFSPGDTPTLTVSDNGQGVAAAAAEKIWLPFFSTRDMGTGMGLATVKKLVSALNGDIQLLNPGEPGAKFRIIFYN